MRTLATYLFISLLALTTCNAPSEVVAEDKTFGGRTFDNWKVLVFNDLDPETRKSATSAIGVLGHHGHRPAALEVLQEAILKEADPSVARSGYTALLTFGDDAIPAVEAGLRAANDEARRNALRALSIYFSITQLRVRNNASLGKLPKKVLPGLIGIMQDVDGAVSDRAMAAKTIRGVLRVQEPDEFANQILEAATKLANSPDLDSATEGLQTIGSLGKHAKPAIPLLISFVEKNEMPRRSNNRQTITSRPMAAALALGRLGPIAKDAIPALEEMQRNSGATRFSTRTAQRALQAIRVETENE